METNRIKTLERLFNKTVKSAQIHDCVLYVENTNGDFSYSNGYGGKDLNSPLLMASITKLFTTTCILALQEQERLSLTDKVSDYFNDTIMNGLHIYGGKEYSYELTISDLLGEIIEKVTNLPLDQVFKQIIFEPLGLSNTYLPISEKDLW